MTNEQLLRYFENRPKLKEIHLVGEAVFVDKPTAKKYADQVKGKVETVNKNKVQAAYEEEKLNLSKLSKEEAELQLIDLDLEADVDETKLSVLVEALGLTVDGDAPEAYVAALINYKAGM